MATKIKGTGIATGAIDSTQLATLSGHLDLSDSNNFRLGNNQDSDDDGDGIPDSSDDFPLDFTEDTDTDGDGIPVL